MWLVRQSKDDCHLGKGWWFNYAIVEYVGLLLESLMKDKLFSKTKTYSIGYSGFLASKLKVNRKNGSNVRDQHGLYLGLRKMEVEKGDSKVRVPRFFYPTNVSMAEEKNVFHGLGGCSPISSIGGALTELVVFSSLFRLVLV